jgi:hypothetical protein
MDEEQAILAGIDEELRKAGFRSHYADSAPGVAVWPWMPSFMEEITESQKLRLIINIRDGKVRVGQTLPYTEILFYLPLEDPQVLEILIKKLNRFFGISQVRK